MGIESPHSGYNDGQKDNDENNIGSTVFGDAGQEQHIQIATTPIGNEGQNETGDNSDDLWGNDPNLMTKGYDDIGTIGSDLEQNDNDIMKINKNEDSNSEDLFEIKMSPQHQGNTDGNEMEMTTTGQLQHEAMYTNDTKR